MKAYTDDRCNTPATSNRRALLGKFALTLCCFAVMFLTGCVGLTGASTPASNSNPNSNPSSKGTLAANSASLSFGNVLTGSSSAQTLTLTNTSTGKITIAQAIVTGAGFSVVGGMASVTIASGQNQSFQVQFAPAASGAVTGAIAISSNASDPALTIALSGTGTAALAISSQPASQSVVAGQSATFAVVAAGSGTLTYQWKKGGTAIGGATLASYTTPATTSADNGAQFSVVVTDSTGSITSNPATLTVTAAAVAPSIATQPANMTVTLGQTATFSVSAAGTSPFTYQWNKNGTAISGATSSSYTTPVTVASDNNAMFTVNVANSVSNVTSNTATLTVNIPPSITSQPVSKTVMVGQSAAFSVVATGSGTLNYQWNKNGAAISGATLSAYTPPAATESDNGDKFTATVTNIVSSVTSNAATLTVNAPPSITGQPTSQTVNIGQAATFSVSAAGTATLTYQWNKGGVAINGATSASYTTPATVASDSGAQFTVTVTNAFRSMTSNAATLTVNVPPTISGQPVSQAVVVGQTATFSVTATGTGTLAYQWKKNSVAISGATSSSYTTPATLASDNGATFAVTITSALGSVTSSTATLTVNAPPTITTQPVSTAVLAGQTATFSVSAAGTATLTYQWNKAGAAISGATSASYTTPATIASDSGAQFTVTVTNAYGSVTSNAATLTVNVPPTISGQPASQAVVVGQTATFSVTATGTGTLAYQ